MSRFGKLPVEITQGATVQVTDGSISVSGPKGNMSHSLPREVGITVSEGELVVDKKGNSKQALALQGTTRSIVKNMIEGVTKGWQKQLELIGSGYRAEVRGQDLILTVGYSHPVTIKAPAGVSFGVEKTIVTVSGPNRADVGQVAALIRATRKPDPYRGKGVKYTDEVLRKKAGKQAAKAAA